MRLPAEMDSDVRAGPHLPAEIVLISYFILKWIGVWVKAMIFLLICVDSRHDGKVRGSFDFLILGIYFWGR